MQCASLGTLRLAPNKQDLDRAEIQTKGRSNEQVRQGTTVPHLSELDEHT
jgi:hypothetical protein